MLVCTDIIIIAYVGETVCRLRLHEISYLIRPLSSRGCIVISEGGIVVGKI